MHETRAAPEAARSEGGSGGGGGSAVGFEEESEWISGVGERERLRVSVRCRRISGGCLCRLQGDWRGGGVPGCMGCMSLRGVSGGCPKVGVHDLVLWGYPWGSGGGLRISSASSGTGGRVSMCVRAVWGVGGDAPPALPVPRSRFPAGAPAARSVEGEGCFARSLRAAKGCTELRSAVGVGISSAALPPPSAPSTSGSGCLISPYGCKMGCSPSHSPSVQGRLFHGEGEKKPQPRIQKKPFLLFFFPKEKKKSNINIRV